MVATLAAATIFASQSAPAGILQGQVGDSGDRSGYVVWVDNIQGNFRPPDRHAVMDQKDLRFIPHVLPILVGTAVDFLNSDPLLHNVFSISEAKRFNLGLYPKGQAPSVKFDKPGVVEVLCNVHPAMSAYIVVLPNPYFALTGPDGRFTIRDVPAGPRTVRCWSEQGKTWEQKVVIAPGAIQVVNFSQFRFSVRR